MDLFWLFSYLIEVSLEQGFFFVVLQMGVQQPRLQWKILLKITAVAIL